MIIYQIIININKGVQMEYNNIILEKAKDDNWTCKVNIKNKYDKNFV